MSANKLEYIYYLGMCPEFENYNWEQTNLVIKQVHVHLVHFTQGPQLWDNLVARYYDVKNFTQHKSGGVQEVKGQSKSKKGPAMFGPTVNP